MKEFGALLGSQPAAWNDQNTLYVHDCSPMGVHQQDIFLLSWLSAKLHEFLTLVKYLSFRHHHKIWAKKPYLWSKRHLALDTHFHQRDLFYSPHVISKASQRSYVNIQWCLTKLLHPALGAVFDWRACDGNEGTTRHGLLQLERTRSYQVEPAVCIEHKKCVQLEIQMYYEQFKKKKLKSI